MSCSQGKRLLQNYVIKDALRKKQWPLLPAGCRWPGWSRLELGSDSRWRLCT